MASALTIGPGSPRKNERGRGCGVHFAPLECGSLEHGSRSIGSPAVSTEKWSADNFDCLGGHGGQHWHLPDVNAFFLAGLKKCSARFLEAIVSCQAAATEKVTNADRTRERASNRIHELRNSWIRH